MLYTIYYYYYYYWDHFIIIYYSLFLIDFSIDVYPFMVNSLIIATPLLTALSNN